MRDLDFRREEVVRCPHRSREWTRFWSFRNGKIFIRRLTRSSVNCYRPASSRVISCAVERRVYVESPGDADLLFRRPDVSVLWTGETAGGTAVAEPAISLEPFECELLMPEERRETYLLIRLQETMEVVTVLETLSPGNKRPGGDGQREYLKKRQQVLQRETHLVELDLLRGGARLPTRRPLPQADYYAVVSRSQRRPKVAVYAWTVRDRLPTVPVPLKPGDRTCRWTCRRPSPRFTTVPVTTCR